MTTTTPTSDLSTSIGSHPGLERLYDNVQAIVPAVQLEIIKLMAWNAIEEFYLKSTYRRELVFWEMAAGVSVIDFNPFDAQWQVAWVLDVKGLVNFKVDMPAVITDLYPATGTRTGTAILALKPASLGVSCGCLPDELFIQWFETILDGTFARIYAAPMKPYSSPQLAAYHMGRFRAGIATARGIAQAGNTNGGGRWSFPTFATGRRKN